MRFEWPTRKLEDCATWYSGGTPSKKNAEFWDGNIPWISAKSLTEFYIRDSETKVTEAGANNGTRLVPKNTILFIVRGMSLKTEFRMGITTRPVTFNQDLKALVPADDILPMYLAYAIKAKTNKILGLVSEASHGTGVLTTEQIQAVEIPIPPLPEQKRIAHILGSLDDKIELNRRMNKTLEAMAQALFKSWFIDFDPVHAKMEGRDPSGMDPQTAALFPNKLTDSPLGPIPKGWEVGKIAEIIQITPRYQLSRGDLAPYLGMADAPEEGHFPHGWYDREFNGSGSKFKNGDTLMAKITPCLENGKTAFVDFLPEDTIGWGSTEYLVLRSKPPFPLEYSYYLARSRPIRQRAIQSMTGSSGRQRVPVRAFREFPIVIPPPDIAQRFGTNARKLMDKIRKNHEESRTMTLVRDMLLLDLLSGRSIV